MITTGTAFTCGGGRTVFCSEANWSLMMRHCRCLLLWDLDTAVEMRTTRCYKFIHVSVITMLLGDIGREDVGMLTQQRPHSAMSKWFPQRMNGVVTDFYSMNSLLNTAMCIVQVTSTERQISWIPPRRLHGKNERHQSNAVIA